MPVSKARFEDSGAVTPFEPRPVTLKDGRTVTLRAATVDDAGPLVANSEAGRRGAANYIVSCVDDPLPTLDEERQWLAGLNPAQGSLLIVAEFEGRIVGSIAARVQSRRRLAHVANLGITSRQSFWNSGIGAAMMSAMIDWCRSHPAVSKLELGVFADNARAISLYRKFGFVEEGRLKRHVQREPGHFVDELVMGLWLAP